MSIDRIERKVATLTLALGLLLASPSLADERPSVGEEAQRLDAQAALVRQRSREEATRAGAARERALEQLEQAHAAAERTRAAAGRARDAR